MALHGNPRFPTAAASAITEEASRRVVAATNLRAVESERRALAAEPIAGKRWFCNYVVLDVIVFSAVALIGVTMLMGARIDPLAQKPDNPILLIDGPQQVVVVPLSKTFQLTAVMRPFQPDPSPPSTL